MDNNNPYKRNYKTKREEYQEKLKQKNDSQEWLFGNIFGKPGSGAPLRDNQGNIISSLKSVTNNNIYKYEAQDFSKGNNNISVLNHRIYNQNAIINDPFSQSYNQMNLYSPNKNISSQIQRLSPNIYNYMDDNKINNMNQQSYNNNNINNILIQPQIPYGYILPYNNNMISYNQIPSFQLQNQNNLLNNNIYVPNYNNYNNNIQPRIVRNNTTINPQINNLNEVNVVNNNSLNISKQEKSRLNKTADNIMNINNSNSNENDFLLISNDNDLNNKIQNEKKIEEWKSDLKKQIEEKQKRKELAKKELEKKEKEEEKKYQEYLEYKNRQAEENKKNKKNKKFQNQISNNFIEMVNNELEKSQQTKSEEQNKNDEMSGPYDQNNPLNKYDIPPEAIKEQEKFKNYIDQTYETLGQSLGQSIENEIIKMSTMLTNKYEPFPQIDNYKRIFNNQNVVRKDKKMEKIQDIIEERQLLDFIIGEKDVFSPFKYKNYDLNKYNLNNEEVPSYFGKNKSSFEKRFVNLDSNSHFVYGDYSNKNKGGKEYKIIFNKEEYENEQKNNNYNNIDNSQSRTFGRNNNNVMDSIGVSQSLDNKTSFVPLNKDVDQKMIDKINQDYNNNNRNDIEEKKKEEEKLPDKIEENILKNLNEIDLLNKNVILYDKEKNIINKNNIQNNNNIYNQPKDNNEQIKNDNELKEKEKTEENQNEIKNEKNINNKDKEEEEENNEDMILGNNNENNTIEIGVQSEPLEIKKNEKEESSKDKEINIINENIQKEGSNQNEMENNGEIQNNQNEMESGDKIGENKEISNEQKDINDNNEEIEESYEESGEEEEEK